MRVFEAIPHLLATSGIGTVFGLPGGSNVGWIAHGAHTGLIRYYGMRYEGAVIAAAGAYAKGTGTVGVASTTVGPGFGNTINAMAALAFEHVPVIHITGHSPNGKGGGDAQQLNQRELCDALGVGYHLVMRPSELEERFFDALEAATWNGSLHVLAIEESILTDPVTLTGRQGPEPREALEPDPDAVSAVVSLLESARNPLIIGGRGAASSGCRDEIVELAELTGARLASTLPVKDYFAGHPRNLGVCGRSSPPAVVEAVYSTDVVLAIGSSLQYYTTMGGAMFPGAKLVQFEIDPNRDFRASAPEYGLLADAKASVNAVIAEWHARGLVARPLAAPVPPPAQVRQSMLVNDGGFDPARGMDPREVYVYLDDALPEDRVVVTDTGRVMGGLPVLLRTRDHHSYIPSRGYGSIGLGLGAAVGAAVAFPDRRVILVTGDGGFAMSTGELDDLRTHGLDVIVFIMNDEQYGSEIKYLRRLDLPLSYAGRTMPDVALLAQAYGGTGYSVRTMDELRRIDLTAQGLVLVDVRVDPQGELKAA